MSNQYGERRPNPLPIVWLFFKQFSAAIIFIVLGVAAITATQLLIYPSILVPIWRDLTWPALGIQPGDWNTAREVWFVEVPLAFLLRWLLQGGGEHLDRKTNNTQNLVSALELNAIESVQHLQYHIVRPTLRHPDGKGYIINTDTHKSYECDTMLNDAAQGLLLVWDDYKKPAMFDDYCRKSKPPIERIRATPKLTELKLVGDAEATED